MSVLILSDTLLLIMLKVWCVVMFLSKRHLFLQYVLKAAIASLNRRE